jgi:hypothetical protein
LKVICGPEGVDGGLGRGTGEVAFSARGAGVDTWPKALCQIKKLMAMRPNSRRKNMEFERRARKLGLYLAEHSCNASNPRAAADHEAGLRTGNE